jgi:hypothetical protein
MSNPDHLKQIKSVADAYAQIKNTEREKAVEQAQAQVEQPTEAPKEQPLEEAAPIFKKVKPGNPDAAIARRANSKYNAEEADDETDEKLKTKKSKTVTINPDLAEDGHTDVSSAIRKCKTIMEDAQDVLAELQAMNPEDGLPSWWMNAITVSAHELNSMRDYIKNPSEDKE